MSDVIDLRAARVKRQRARETNERSYPPLFVSHKDGKITDGNNRPEFGDRLDKIRASIAKINRLMTELKSLSEVRNVDNSKN